MITPGTRLGSYRVDALVGQGGMGEVYRGVDTRLDRVVAIKVLPAELASHPQLRERFEREARAISSLSHPNICTLFDVGEQDGTGYLVMEFLEGESLADRLMRGALPLDDAIRYAIEIAGALEKAHRRGIIHRDLKPGNIMLTKSGAKLLDFGLARTATSPLVGPDAPTEQHKPLTAEGTILGTFQYMAPEQLEGVEADARTDIFAFGTVLYEMLTGRRAFEGKTRTSLIAAIVGGELRPAGEFQPLMPAALEHVIALCVEKDPDDRWQSAHDIAAELRWIAANRTLAPAKNERSKWKLAAAIAGAVVLAALAGWGGTKWRADKGESQLVQSSLALPPGMNLSPASGDDLIALSPDGRTIAFTARDASGKSQLWVRPLAERRSRALPATENARHPFWSPDGNSIAFFSNGKLRRIALDGSPPVAICDVASNPIGGAWSERGVILFSPGSGGPLHRVDASGGKPVAVTTLDTASRETTHRWPRFLPDGEHFLYLAASHDLPEMAETNAIYLAKLGSPERKLLLRARANVEYANGHLFFVRQNTLYAQAFDAEAGELEGQPRAIATDVDYNALPMLSVFSVGAGRELVFATAGPQRKRRIVWLDREGKVLQTIADADHYLEGSLSRDGKTLLATIEDPSVGNDLWLHDLSTNALTRLTLGGTGEQGVWSPDGARMVYSDGKGHIYLRGVGDAAEPELIWTMDGGWGGPTAWSPDGKYVTLWRFAPGSPNSYDALLLSLDDRKTVPLAATTASEFPGQFSPDGKWLTYTSNASGREEIYVVSFPDLAVRRQVSSVGGYGSVWIAPREIWIQRAGGSVFSTTLLESPNGTVSFSPARLQFTAPEITRIEPLTTDPRLLGVHDTMEGPPQQFIFVNDWTKLGTGSQ